MRRVAHFTYPILAASLLALAACTARTGGTGAAPAPEAGVDDAAAGQGASDEGGSDGPVDASGDDDDGAGSGGGDDAGTASDTDGGSSAGGFVPTFPGGPASGSGPLMGGKVCDEVPGVTTETLEEVTRCFFSEEQTIPTATIEQVLECVDDMQTLHLRLTFNPTFNDNTYGEGSIGWPRKRGHRFRDLTGSDHAELILLDGEGEVAMQFKLDYLEADSDAPSGYASQCHEGGDGNVTVGDPAHIVDCTTSLDENLNARGYGDYTVDSPLTDENFTSNPDAPEWDYRMVFEVWVDAAAFGDAGFSGAFIEYVHASPAKSEKETIEVTSDECPPCMNLPDDTCGDAPPPTEEDECVNLPDDICGESPPVKEDEPPFCARYPTNPACTVI